MRWLSGRTTRNQDRLMLLSDPVALGRRTSRSGARTIRRAGGVACFDRRRPPRANAAPAANREEPQAARSRLIKAVKKKTAPRKGAVFVGVGKIPVEMLPVFAQQTQEAVGVTEVAIHLARDSSMVYDSLSELTRSRASSLLQEIASGLVISTLACQPCAACRVTAASNSRSALAPISRDS